LFLQRTPLYHQGLRFVQLLWIKILWRKLRLKMRRFLQYKWVYFQLLVTFWLQLLIPGLEMQCCSNLCLFFLWTNSLIRSLWQTIISCYHVFFCADIQITNSIICLSHSSTLGPVVRRLISTNLLILLFKSIFLGNFLYSLWSIKSWHSLKAKRVRLNLLVKPFSSLNFKLLTNPRLC